MGFNVSSIYGVNPITDRRRKPRLISNTTTQATVQPSSPPSLIGLPPQHPPNIPYGTGQIINSIFGSGTARQVVPAMAFQQDFTGQPNMIQDSLNNSYVNKQVPAQPVNYTGWLSGLFNFLNNWSPPQSQPQPQGLAGLPPQPINAGAINFNPFMIGR